MKTLLWLKVKPYYTNSEQHDKREWTNQFSVCLMDTCLNANPSIYFPVTVITGSTCQFERAAFRECNSCRTCLKVATEIKHIGVKKCQPASPWLLQSSSWQCAGKVQAQECCAHLSTQSRLPWQMPQRGFL